MYIKKNLSTLIFGFLQLAQPIRLLLEYTGEEYEDKYYVCGEGNLSFQPIDLKGGKNS